MLLFFNSDYVAVEKGNAYKVQSQITLLEMWELATNEMPVSFDSVCLFYSIYLSSTHLKCIYLAALGALSILPTTLAAGLSIALPCVL